MSTFLTQEELKLRDFARALVDEQKARVAVPAMSQEKGFWFGGGNMIEFAGALYITGRYRNSGDSRTGLALGDRGSELAIFKSADKGKTFQKVNRILKTELPGGVLSIEGTAMCTAENGGVMLFISSEKRDLRYPEGFEQFQKPNTGVWSIDVISAATPEELAAKAGVVEVCRGSDPNYIHYKDPFVYNSIFGEKKRALLFCTHPFNWTSSNTAYAELSGESIGKVTEYFFPKGQSWDVAMTRGTCVFDVPPVGAFLGKKVSLFFYDGGECVRNLEEHTTAVKRNRGYSCEELGGLAYFEDGDMAGVKRISKFEPLFESPYGTGCSRYVQVCETQDGIYATWQQSQNDGSQPLVIHFLGWKEVEELLR